MRGLLTTTLAFVFWLGCAGEEATRGDPRATGPFGPGPASAFAGSGAPIPPGLAAGRAAPGAPGVPGAASDPTSKAAGGASTTLNLAGAPQYTRFVGLTIIAGNGRGYLKQGASFDAANSTNNKVHNALITAASRDKTSEAPNFGKGSGTGPLAGMLA